MGRKGYAIAAVVVIALAIAAVVVATRTSPTSLGGADATGDGSIAPALDAKGWLNSDPLTPAELKGKVVVYDFWTYSCVNCVRTIPYLRSWYDRYKADGLVVIGVHSPEFDFEKDHGNVAKAVTKLGVDYPVAFDDDMTIWNAFANQYWPADYIYDRAGKQASVHFGEGGYDETENRLRQLLGVATDSPRAQVGSAEGGSAAVGTSPETYIGSSRGNIDFASPEPLTDGTSTFTAPDNLRATEHALQGAWTVQPDYSDLYPLVADDAIGTHTLRLTATAPGLRAYAFTFGG